MPDVYIVNYSSGVDSVHATIESANERASTAKEEGKTAVKVEPQELQGGTVVVEKKKAAPKAKAPAKAKAAPENDETEAPKAAAAKQTKPVAEKRAVNAKKPAKPAKPGASDIPDNVKALLAGSGRVLSGKTVVVTGIPPTLGRKTAEALVTAYGGKIVKAVSKSTKLVVLGDEAGPKKLEQIEEYGIETLDEDALIELLEKSGSGTKRSADDEEDDDEEEEEEEEEKEKAVRGKKQKR
ncbi:hypothetical protein B7494_g6882 [Chlorociboria aeruginascens]|nr:hypothetical protein B7494_g6882 [Chlorociboria aeruginascens]